MKAADTALNEVNKDLARLEEEENNMQKESMDIQTELNKYKSIMKENQDKVKHWTEEVLLKSLPHNSDLNDHKKGF